MNYFMIDGKRIEISAETADEMRKAYGRIRVPDGIRFIVSNGLASIGLIFNDDTQVVGYEYSTERWIVEGCHGTWNDSAHPLYLTPCSRSELKAGDWAYRTDNAHSNFKELSNYSLITSSSEYAYVEQGGASGVGVAPCKWQYWYKVTK